VTVYEARPVKRRRRTNAELELVDESVYDASATEHPVSLRGVYYRRAKGFVGESVEVDALPATALRAIVREAIEQHIDPRRDRLGSNPARFFSTTPADTTPTRSPWRRFCRIDPAPSAPCGRAGSRPPTRRPVRRLP
jgi:hypothetical protein